MKEILLQHKIAHTICSVQELRLPIFAPINKTNPNSSIYMDFIHNKRSRKVQTQWGEVEVKGSLLTQVHKDLLDLMVFCAKNKKLTNDNRLLLEFSTADLLKLYGDKGFNYKWFKNLLDEIMLTVIHLKTKEGTSYAFHIISAMEYNDKKEFVGVLLSSEYLQFYKDTFAINYNKEIPRLIGLKNSVVKSIIRFFLSHNTLNISLENCFPAIGIKAEKNTRYYRKLKQELIQNAKLLSNFNIELKDECFIYKGNDNVKFFLN